MWGSIGYGIAGLTQTAGVLIQAVVPARAGLRAVITLLMYLSQATAHTITILRSLARTKCTVAVSSIGGATITVKDSLFVASNPISSNDYLVIRETDSVCRPYKVSSVSGTGNVSITLTANLTTGVAVNSDVWWMGITTDTDPRTGSAHPVFISTANVTAQFPANGSIPLGLAALDKDEPLLVSSNNATNAGTIAMLSWTHDGTSSISS